MTPATWLSVALALARLAAWIMDTKAVGRGVAMEKARINDEAREQIAAINAALDRVSRTLDQPDGLRSPDANRRPD